MGKGWPAKRLSLYSGCGKLVFRMAFNSHKERQLIIRADASSKIGTGHILRCLVLAERWAESLGGVTFLTSCESDLLRRRILEDGFHLFSVEKVYPAVSDIEESLGFIGDLVREHCLSHIWVVLDGYHLDVHYQKRIKDMGIHVLVIDDTGHLGYYHADVLLNQNAYARTISYHCNRKTRLLLGPEYALLRREFLTWREWRKEFSKRGSKVLVTMGGSDPENVTGKVIHALKKISDPELEVKLVLGPYNAHEVTLKKNLISSPFRYELIQNVRDMPSLMAWADVAISGAGTTCIELCFMGVPSLVIVLAENQRLVAEEMERKGCSVNLGHKDELNPENLAQTLLELTSNAGRRIEMGLAGQCLVDGFGVERVLEALVGAELRTGRSQR